MRTFILAFGPLPGRQGQLIRPERILDALFGQKSWFLRRLTRRIAVGDRVLLYQTGAEKTGAGFRAYASVEKVGVPTPEDASLMRELGVSRFGIKVSLSDVIVFPAAHLQRHANNLQFVTNKVSWGQSIRFTPREIPEGDVEYVALVAGFAPHNACDGALND